MKRITGFAVLLLLATKSSFGQSITLAELIQKTGCKNINCYKSYMRSKGFSLIKDTALPFYRTYMFQSEKPSRDSQAKLFYRSAISFYNDKSQVDVAIATFDKTIYESLVKEIEKSDFKKVVIPPSNEQTSTYYDRSTKNKKITLLLDVYTKENEPNRYSITVSRHKR